MESKLNIHELLMRMDCPAFCVRDGIILAANQAALARMIPVGDPIGPLLHEGKSEYSDFSEGYLYLSLLAGGTLHGATVSKTEAYDLFQLEPSFEGSELQALALASRELREPLNQVFIFTDELFSRLSGTSDPQALQQMAQINRGLYQLQRLVSNMSDAGAISMGHLQLRNVTAVAQDIFDEAQHFCAEAGRKLEFSNLPVCVYSLVDEDRLERAIYNILSNALKHTPAGGTIRARLHRRDSSLYFTVEDSGSGMDPRVLPNAFRRFLREPVLEDGSHGIGLGLTLVRSAAIVHGGTVLLKPMAEGGLQTTLSLPIRQNTASLRSSILRVDYAGERSHALVELSDILPAHLYTPNQI